MKTLSIRAKKPHSASSVLENTLKYTLKGLKLDKKAKQYDWFRYWDDIVGKEISEVSYPEQIKNGRLLVVRVVDIAWVQELALKKQEILDSIFESDIFKSGMGVSVEDISFIACDPKTFSTNKSSTSKQSR